MQGFCAWQIFRITNTKKRIRKFQTQCAETLTLSLSRPKNTMGSKPKVWPCSSSNLRMTQAHSKYVPLNTFLQHHYYVPYCTFRCSFKVKRPVSGTKTWVQYVTLARFCYVDIGTYCCVCITLLQARIAVVRNSNIRWVSLKVNALVGHIPYTKPNLKLTR